jgi:subtilisin family serine protease
MNLAGPGPAAPLSWGLWDKRPEDIVLAADGEGVSPSWAWEGASGDGIRVCVVDSGIEQGHPLVGPVAGSFAVVTEETGLMVQETGAGDCCGHGTACASIIRRAAPDCEVTSIRILGERLSATGDVLLAALRWAIRQRFDVINLSLSTTRARYAAELRSLADEAYFGRAVIVASAHNAQVESFPWRFSSVISVGSHREDDPDLYLYNPQPPVEFFAPGQNVEVAWRDGTTIRSSGNSYATPFISGLCARVLSKHRRLTVFQLKNALYLSAANVRTGTGGNS